MTAALDMNSPFVQQMLKANPNLLQQLGLSPPAPSPAALTADQVRQIIDERIAAAAPAPPALMAKLEKFEQVFRRALPAADYAAFQKYVADGSPGFAEILAGDKLHPIAQLLWETIKDATAE